MIVLQALNKATKKNAVVHCIDTDAFITLLHHFDILNFANMVVNVVLIAVKYAVLPPNALFTLVLRLRKS